MKNPHMLYRCPGSEVFEGVRCETLVVEAEDVEAAKAEGWCCDWIQAKAAHDQALADSQKPENADPAAANEAQPVKRGPGRPRKE